MNKSLLVIALITLIFNISCEKNPTSSKNTAPIASFTITPASGGTTATVFTFDASGCTDNEDGTSVLEVRWDWNNDGTWDTDYSTTKTATHQYAATGTYTVKLEVRDSEGLTNTTNMTVAVKTETILTFQNNSDCLMIAEIDISSTSYTKRIYLDKMLFEGESVSDTLLNMPTGNYAIKVCCVTKWTVGIIGGVYVNEYECSMLNTMYFDITEGEENIITFN